MKYIVRSLYSCEIAFYSNTAKLPSTSLAEVAPQIATIHHPPSTLNQGPKKPNNGFPKIQPTKTQTYLVT